MVSYDGLASHSGWIPISQPVFPRIVSGSTVALTRCKSITTSIQYDSSNNKKEKRHVSTGKVSNVLVTLYFKNHTQGVH